VTPDQIYSMFITACGAIITVSGALAVIFRAVKAAKAPNDLQNERLTKLEERVARHDELFAKDNKRLTAIEEGNRVVQKALLALLEHWIDGSNIDAIKKAKEELQSFLIDK